LPTCDRTGRRIPLRRVILRIPDELLAVELFHTLAGAKLVVQDRRHHYNTKRPHSALVMTAPINRQPTLTQSGPTSGVRSANRRPSVVLARRRERLRPGFCSDTGQGYIRFMNRFLKPLGELPGTT
jgi:Integrase core domain